MPLYVPLQANQVWSADFMQDACGTAGVARTFNVIDDFNREALAIEIGTGYFSLKSRVNT